MKCVMKQIIVTVLLKGLTYLEDIKVVFVIE